MLHLVGYIVPNSLADGIVVALFVGVLSWLAYMMKQVTTQAGYNATTASELKGLGDRITRLEGWQDGIQFGRAAAHLEHERKDRRNGT